MLRSVFGITQHHNAQRSGGTSSSESISDCCHVRGSSALSRKMRTNTKATCAHGISREPHEQLCSEPIDTCRQKQGCVLGTSMRRSGESARWRRAENGTEASWLAWNPTSKHPWMGIGQCTPGTCAHSHPPSEQMTSVQAHALRRGAQMQHREGAASAPPTAWRRSACSAATWFIVGLSPQPTPMELGQQRSNTAKMK